MQRITAPYTTKPTTCTTCGGIIGFHKLVSGKWMPVDLYIKNGRNIRQVTKLSELNCIPKGETPIYYTNMGNHNNFTPRHQCTKIIDTEMDFEWTQREQILNIEYVLKELAVYRLVLAKAAMYPEAIETAIEERLWAEKEWEVKTK